MARQATPFAAWQKWLIGVMTAATLGFSGWASTTLFGLYTTVIELRADVKAIKDGRDRDKADVDRRFSDLVVRIRDLEHGARASRAD